jgi:hypothetical protein
MRESVDDIDEGTDNMVIEYWEKMMKRYGDADTCEEAMKNKFCDGEIDILIVCSKLLTGFDAPICQVLYIDRELKEHGLLQAIARTNRLREGKEYGLIVDYRGLIQKLDAAMDMYSGAGLENFEGGDLKGVVVDVMDAVGQLRTAYTNLVDLFTDVKNLEDSEAVEVSLADAVALADGVRVIVKGTVKEINTEWSEKYGNITVTIEDAAGNTLYIYRLATNVKVGDVVTITGKMGSYNGSKQIAAGATAVIGE